MEGTHRQPNLHKQNNLDHHHGVQNMQAETSDQFLKGSFDNTSDSLLSHCDTSLAWVFSVANKTKDTGYAPGAIKNHILRTDEWTCMAVIQYYKR